jgi:hypothetical protein
MHVKSVHASSLPGLVHRSFIVAMAILASDWMRSVCRDPTSHLLAWDHLIWAVLGRHSASHWLAWDHLIWAVLGRPSASHWLARDHLIWAVGQALCFSLVSSRSADLSSVRQGLCLSLIDLRSTDQSWGKQRVCLSLVTGGLRSADWAVFCRDAGQYSLVAYNKTGELWHHFTIRVKGQFPVPIRCQLISPLSLSLSLSFSSHCTVYLSVFMIFNYCLYVYPCNLIYWSFLYSSGLSFSDFCTYTVSISCSLNLRWFKTCSDLFTYSGL